MSPHCTAYRYSCLLAPAAPLPSPPQAVELKATKVLHVGVSDAASYPIAKKKTSYEFLREKMHLRPRTNTIGAVARIRNALAFATHRFFQVRSGAAAAWKQQIAKQTGSGRDDASDIFPGAGGCREGG